MKLVYLITASLLFFASTAPAKTKPKAGSSGAVLELEADVIEGEKRLPAIFLEFESHAPTLDSVIFMRNDFNDLTGSKAVIPYRFHAGSGKK